AGIYNLILHAAAIGFRLRCFDRLACFQRVNRGRDIVFGRGGVGGFGAVIVIDGAGIDEGAILVDHEHVRRRLGVIGFSDLAFAIQKIGGLFRAHVLDIGVGGVGRQVALLAFRAGI